MASKKSALRIEVLPAPVSDEEAAKHTAAVYRWILKQHALRGQAEPQTTPDAAQSEATRREMRNQ